MTDPSVELDRARIRYLGAYVRGEITEPELNKKLAMIVRAEKRLASIDNRLEKQRDAVANWRQRRRLERALRQSLEASNGL